MTARVKRPDLEGTLAFVAECCGSAAGERFCESFGCSSITELIAYAQQLEQDAAGLRAVADAAAAWKDGTNFRRCDYRCQHVDCALAALLAAAS